MLGMSMRLNHSLFTNSYSFKVQTKPFEKTRQANLNVSTRLSKPQFHYYKYIISHHKNFSKKKLDTMG